MRLSENWRRTLDRVDGFGGRLVYRFFGLFAAIIGALAGWKGGGLLLAGDSILGGLLLLVPGLLCLWLARWCFSPSRRLSEIDS